MALTFYHPIKSTISESILTLIVVTIANVMFALWSPYDTIVITLTIANGALFYNFNDVNMNFKCSSLSSMMRFDFKEKVDSNDEEEEERKELS